MPGAPLRYSRFAYNWKLASLVNAMRDLPVNAVCLHLIVAHPELSARDAAEEAPCLRLSVENECEKEQPTWRRSCRSTIRRDPKLSPLARARSRTARGHCQHKQIATAAKFPVLGMVFMVPGGTSL
jgi:hypothetical protein